MEDTLKRNGYDDEQTDHRNESLDNWNSDNDKPGWNINQHRNQAASHNRECPHMQVSTLGSNCFLVIPQLVLIHSFRAILFRAYVHFGLIHRICYIYYSLERKRLSRRRYCTTV